MIDFDALVLNPLEGVFSLRVRFYPEATRPGTGPYNGRGVFSSGPVDVAMEDGQIFSDQQTTLGIRNADFTNMPGRGDIVHILEGPNTGKRYWIGDVDADGQGGSTLLLRTEQP